MANEHYDDPRKIPKLPFHEHFMKQISSYSNRTAIIDFASNSRWTFLELSSAVERLAASLQSELYRLKKGQVVALALPNCAEFIVSMLAVMKCGGVVTMINPGWKLGELEHAISISQPSLWICTTEVEGLLRKRPLDQKAIIVLDLANKNSNWHSILKSCRREEFTCLAQYDVNQDLALLPFSSGTTGLPKAVMLSHHNVVANLCQYRLSFPQHDVNDVTLGLLPMYHQYGCFNALGALSVGARLITVPKFSFSGMLRAIEDHKITILPLVPPILNLLSKLEVKTAEYNLSSVKTVIYSAAPMRDEILETLKKMYQWEFKHGYGMTECYVATQVTSHDIMINGNKCGSVGKRTDFTQTKIIDPLSGKQLGQNEVGELCVRGPMLMKGYLNNASATAATIDAGGWLHTGDLAYYDEDGWIYIAGRLKELIKFKGNQVAPAELEHILLSHPDVIDAAVVGVPDEIAGELPRAYVVKRPEADLTEEQVVSFLNGQVSSYKHLRGGVDFIDAIPRTPVGKILRQQLISLSSKSSL